VRFAAWRVLATFLVFAVLGLAPDARAQSSVQLLRVDAYEFSARGVRGDFRVALVKVADVAFEKRVSLFMEYEDGVWRESYGTYVGPAEPGFELWRVSALNERMPWTPRPIGPRWADELVVKYEVAGQTYWDNNQGRNYVVGPPADAPGEMLFAGLNLLQLQASASAFGDASGPQVYFSGVVNVRNLAFQKNVVVRYTTDGWRTQAELPARFQSFRGEFGVSLDYPNGAGIERWVFDAYLPGHAQQIEYAIRYEVAGQTFWDNNFGQNYRIEPY
jgi:hypothetical protein